MIRTNHDGAADESFSELRLGLDEVSFLVSDLAGLEEWETELAARGLRSDLRRTE